MSDQHTPLNPDDFSPELKKRLVDGAQKFAAPDDELSDYQKFLLRSVDEQADRLFGDDPVKPKKK
jgi:hypothetical protein